MKISYNWLKWYIDPLPQADELAEKIIAGAFEVEEVVALPHAGEGQDGVSDTIFEIKVLPDRAHDCLSHRGMAREIAGLIGSTFIDPTEKFIVPPSHPTSLTIDIQTDTCRRYSARMIRNITIGPSPEWVVKHLESIGQRSINNVVDATNLVMFDCGQPTHAFDAKKLPQEKIIIKNIDAETSFTTLSKEEKIVSSGDMVICSEEPSSQSGNEDSIKILALAGVKGGIHAEVDEHTTDIIIEVANFDPVSVRKTARRLNLLTDSAKRFENELTPALVPYAMRELSATLLEMCPNAFFEDIVDIYPNPIPQKHVVFTTDYINERLGTTMSSDDIAHILNNYAYEYAQDGGTFTVAIPYERVDITGPHDMIEEVGRAYGYHRIAARLPLLTREGQDQVTPALNPTFAKICLIKDDLLKKGYHEVMNYSFRKKGDYEVARGPVGKSALRTNLSDGLKESFDMNRLNKDFLEIDEMKIFEVGTVFTKKGEFMHVAMGDKQGIVEMTFDEYVSKFLGNLLETGWGETYAIPSEGVTEQKPFSLWSEFPSMTRDIAVWTPSEVSAEQVLDLIHTHAGGLLVKGPRLFDTFSKDGRTSYAFRLVFQSPDRTLVDDDISSDMGTITQALQQQGWEIR